jgi:hypothetical protein
MNQMPSSTSSFNLRLAAFLGAILVSGCLLESYCRISTRFNDDHFVYVRTVTAANARNAVFGDSHVGLTPMIEGYAFLGQAAQQPQELLNLVHFLYDNRQPGRVILEAAPQWVGEYHKGRPPLLTTANLRPPISLFGTRMLSVSPLYSGSLFKFLIADLASLAAFVSPSRAQQLSINTSQVDQYAREWARKRDALGETFNWAQIEQEKRQSLTAARLYGQNPVRDFESSSLLRDYAAAIRVLLERGAEVCLFRTPVTADYLRIGQEMSDGRFDAFDHWIKRFSGAQHIRFVDFRDLPIVFDDTKFLNQDHLTTAQAKTMWPLVAKACFDEKP